MPRKSPSLPKTASNPPGRPTLYGPAIIEKANEYLVGYEELGDRVPQIAGLAIHLHISRDTVLEWAKDPTKPEFSGIVKEVLAGQERKLVNGGLDGTFQQKTTGLMLSKHGYRDEDEEKKPPQQITYNVFQIPEVKVAVLNFEKEIKHFLTSNAPTPSDSVETHE
jgi:DNA-packaging protein gp3